MLAEYFIATARDFEFGGLGDFNLEMLGFDFRFTIYALVFLGALMAFEGLRQFLSRGENRNEARNRRMKMLASGKTEEQVLMLLKPKTKRGLLSRLPFVGDLRSAEGCPQ